MSWISKNGQSYKNLSLQLNVIRIILNDVEPEPPPRTKQKAQIGIVYDVLTKAKEPLHLTEIIRRAKSNFNMDIEPGSIVSALTKKVNSSGLLRRVSPGAFKILEVSKKTP